jgi:NAD(P)-dependent dehydrogenase (short-subunit alcohol dehydrogenase family)
MKLKDKVAIVTGSRRGLGKAIALGFAREGANLVLSDRVVEGGELDGVAEEIKALGRGVLVMQCDVTDEQSINDLVQRTVEQFGRIDVLVNNAGTAVYSPVLEVPTRQWQLVIQVNLIGPFLCTKAVLPKMVEQKSGSIINISSIAANQVDFTGVAYGASKAALERFTRGLAAEVGTYNIAVNALKPIQGILTEGMRTQLPDADESQWASPDLMVKAAIFLAAQDATGVSGTVAFDEEICSYHGLT